jgi:O-antigen ligase
MEVGVGGLALLAGVAWMQGTRVVRRTPLDGVLAFLFASLAVSTLASGRPWEAIGWMRMWVVLGYFGVYWWLDDRESAMRFARWLLLAGVVAAAYGVLQHYTGADWYRALLGRPRMVKPRVGGAHGFASVGFFRNYVTYAHVLVLPFGFGMARAVTGGVAAMGGAIVLGLAIIFSTARGAWVAALAMGAALIAVRRRGVALVLVAGLVIAGAWLASPGLREQVLPALTTTETNAGRLGIYRANLDIIHDHPIFGLGFGRYQQAARPYYDRHPEADRRSHAHNNFLQVAAEAGLVGLAAFALLLATAIRYGAQAMARLPDGPLRETALGAWLGIVGFVVGGFTHYSFGDGEVAIAMWATLAVLMRLRDG